MAAIKTSSLKRSPVKHTYLDVSVLFPDMTYDTFIKFMQGGIGYLSMDYSYSDTFGQWTATFQPQTKVVVFRFKCTHDFLKYKKETRRKYLGGYMYGDDLEGRLMESLENFSGDQDAQWLHNPYLGKGKIVKQQYRKLSAKSAECKSHLCVKGITSMRQYFGDKKWTRIEFDDVYTYTLKKYPKKWVFIDDKTGQPYY
jgi:hypothetical protein